MIGFVLAREADAPIIARLRQKIWATTYRSIYPEKMLEDFDYDWHTSQDLARIRNEKYVVQLILEAGKPVGYLTLKHGEPLHVMSLYMLKEYQHRGIGKMAFALIRRYCAERGISDFTCQCHPENKPAMAFYHAMGGTITARDEESVESWQNSVTFSFKCYQFPEKEV